MRNPFRCIEIRITDIVLVTRARPFGRCEYKAVRQSVCPLNFTLESQFDKTLFP